MLACQLCGHERHPDMTYDWGFECQSCGADNLKPGAKRPDVVDRLEACEQSK